MRELGRITTINISNIGPLSPLSPVWAAVCVCEQVPSSLVPLVFLALGLRAFVVHVAAAAAAVVVADVCEDHEKRETHGTSIQRCSRRKGCLWMQEEESRGRKSRALTSLGCLPQAPIVESDGEPVREEGHVPRLQLHACVVLLPRLPRRVSWSGGGITRWRGARVREEGE